MNHSLQQRTEGGLLGLLIGDALGVPYEFTPPESIPEAALIEFQPPPGFRRAHFGVPPGTWSDDGAHALILLDSLLRSDGLNLDDLAGGLQRWMLEGFYAVNRAVFDVGRQTSTALNRLQDGAMSDVAGPAEERHNGNGSLMRVLPLALWHRGLDAELVALAARQSLPTHGHPRSQAACAFYCLWARNLLEGHEDGWQQALIRMAQPGVSDALDPAELALVLDEKNRTAAGGTGYVVDTLWSARLALERSGSYETCVRTAIGFGNDTDTTAAVAGGLAGVVYGAKGIPERWKDALRGRELVAPLLEKLMARTGQPRTDGSQRA